MINNRLFKKINAIFWGILTWLPIVLVILVMLSRSFDYQVDNQSTLGVFFADYLNTIYESFSNNSDLWYNPLSDVFNEITSLLDTVGSGSFFESLTCICAWVCWVQVMRLLVYVFYWFIDLISGLFDLMTFNRKGDN